ncbi:hypothetical protein FRC10_006426 [Ceratobasidium sp. 414]|nr:hypothetical protein FRC10_006426 [Ceratobasidium sp. 414]
MWTDRSHDQFDGYDRSEWVADVVGVRIEYDDGVESAEVYCQSPFFNGARWTDVIAKDLETAVQMPNSPFVRCQPYFPYFYKYGQMYNVPPILIASFANQESGCNPSTAGGAGEVGMMQITPDKCTGAPGGNCADVDFNVHTAVAYFASQLQANNNSLLHSIGAYQMCNGWMQGIDVYATGMGSYFNLAVCDHPTSSLAAPTPASTPPPAPTP